MIFRSSYPEVQIPDVPLATFVLQRADEYGDRVAFVDGPSGRSYTFRQISAAIRAVAAGLAERGFGKGDVFGIYSPNLPEYPIAFNAVAMLGGICTTANPLLTAKELSAQLIDAGARYLLTVAPFLDRAREAADAAGMSEVFVFGEAEGANPFSSLMRPGGAVPDVAIDPARDVVVLPYSSGTTGLPKGVMLTHRNLVANMIQTEAAEPIGIEDTLIGILPFFHIYGMVVVMNRALWQGARVVSMPRFDLEQFLQLMQDYEVTRAYLAPPIVLALAKHPAVAHYHFPKLRAILSGAAPLGQEVAQAAADRLGCIVKQGYGLTEASPVLHIAPDDLDPGKRGSIGLLVSNTEARIVDPATGRDLNRNETGELWTRGPQVMRGYLNNPQATELTIAESEWLRTGDIAYVDDHGYYFVVDRLKELIKYKGMQVAPAELEALLLSNPAISDAAVIPAPDEEAGEVPVAYVVRRGEISADDLMAWVAKRVAPHKRIRRVEFIEQIPKSASGKILRRILVDQQRGRAAANFPSPAAAGEA